MERRNFLKRTLQVGAVAGIGSLAGCQYYLGGRIKNPCLTGALPEHLRNHELMEQALSGLDFSKLWDCHFHLVGNGQAPSIDGQNSGIWLNPNMTKWTSPKQRIQYGFYLNASCINDASQADSQFLHQVYRILEQIPAGSRFMLLAFDHHYSNDGKVIQDMSSFYVPNLYASRMAAAHNQLEWVASVHPYREDALEALEWCAKNGAKAVKWLPPAMNIDPASPKIKSYYDKLVELGLPLLTHAGDEKAVHGEELQTMANPLKLRVPLEQGVKVIVAHCASLGKSKDLESKSGKEVSNFELFGRLMEDKQYQSNLLADISAINLVNREMDEIQSLLSKQHWHNRLLYASDYPLPGVMPIISTRYMASHGLLEKKVVPFLNEVRDYNVWLFDFLIKRLMRFQGQGFANGVFETSRHFNLS